MYLLTKDELGHKDQGNSPLPFPKYEIEIGFVCGN